MKRMDGGEYGWWRGWLVERMGSNWLVEKMVGGDYGWWRGWLVIGGEDGWWR
jgi:hypothetical protein